MPLSAEEITELLRISERGKRKSKSQVELQPGEWHDVEIVCTRPCPECGVMRDENGYCINPTCSVDRRVDTLGCYNCGYCTTPGFCVLSVECPICIAGIGFLCRSNNTKAVSALHEERWELVRALYGTHYTGNDSYGISLRALELLT